LDKLDIAGQRISLQRLPAQTATVLLKPAKGLKSDPGKVPSDAPHSNDEDTANSSGATKVVQLSNMTTSEDLEDDELYQELIEDVREECNRFGQVLDVVVPRGNIAGLGFDVLGKIYVHLSSVDGAASVLKAVAGRKFNGLTVEACYLSEEAFLAKVSASPSLLRSLAFTVRT
jgi:hypothetical protein